MGPCFVSSPEVLVQSRTVAVGVKGGYKRDAVIAPQSKQCTLVCGPVVRVQFRRLKWSKGRGRRWRVDQSDITF
jgi:hypothetical protein